MMRTIMWNNMIQFHIELINLREQEEFNAIVV